MRAIPGLVTLRPGDANEVVEAYRYIMQLRHQPAVLVLSPPAPCQLGSEKVRGRLWRCARAYVLADAAGRTGSHLYCDG